MDDAGAGDPGGGARGNGDRRAQERRTDQLVHLPGGALGEDGAGAGEERDDRRSPPGRGEPGDAEHASRQPDPRPHAHAVLDLGAAEAGVGGLGDRERAVLPGGEGCEPGVSGHGRQGPTRL
ncbi:MAG: hypothetical protein R2711_15735 [Acidimicrobiales bacterium]